MAAPLVMYMLEQWAQKRERERARQQEAKSATAFKQLGNILGSKGPQTKEPQVGGMEVATNWPAGTAPGDTRTQLQRVLGIEDPEARRVGLNILQTRGAQTHAKAMQEDRQAEARKAQAGGKTKMWTTLPSGNRTELDVPDAQIKDFEEQGWQIGSKPTAPPKTDKVKVWKPGKGNRILTKEVKPAQVPSMVRNGWAEGTATGAQESLKAVETDEDILAKMTGIERAMIKLDTQGTLDDAIYAQLGTDDPELVALLKGSEGDIDAAKAHLQQRLDLYLQKLSPDQREEWLKRSSETPGEKVKHFDAFAAEALAK